ncbi:hypothetical protein RUND412_009789 [Rhizina undulata]
MEKGINNTNLGYINSLPAGNNAGNVTMTYTSLLHVAFQNRFGATRIYHIEIDSGDSDMLVMGKIRKRYFATMSLVWRFWPGTKLEVTTARVQPLETRDIESQEDGFEVDVTDVLMANPFLTNGLRYPSRMKSVQGSIHRHIDFAMHPKQTAGGAAAGKTQEFTKDLPVDWVEGKSGESAERASKETARVSSKASTVNYAQRTSGQTSEDSAKVTIQSTAANIAVETPDKASKAVVESAIRETAKESIKYLTVSRAKGTSRETAEDFVEGTAEATVESITAESTDSDRKGIAGGCVKHSPGYRAEGTSGKTVEDSTEGTTQPTAEIIIGETADRPSENIVKKAINETATESSKD